MESYFVIGLILTANFSRTFGIRILLQDLGIPEYYLNNNPTSTGQSSTSAGPTSFIHLGNAARHEQCLKITTEAVRFSSVSKHEPDVQLTNISSRVQRLNEYINAYYADTTERLPSTTLEVVFHTESTPHAPITGVPCLLRPELSLYITKGSNDNHFYIFGYDDDDSESSIYAKFWGFVEEVTTTVDEEVSVDQEALDQAFHTSLKSKARGKRSVSDRIKSIHKLNNFNQLRACSSAYIVWFGVNNVQGDVLHSVREVEDLNLTLTAEEFVNPDVARAVNSVDLIQCAIDAIDVDEPQFYLATDDRETGAAFILTAEFIEDDHNDMELRYRITMRLQNVLGLETLG